MKTLFTWTVAVIITFIGLIATYCSCDGIDSPFLGVISALLVSCPALMWWVKTILKILNEPIDK